MVFCESADSQVSRHQVIISYSPARTAHRVLENWRMAQWLTWAELCRKVCNLKGCCLSILDGPTPRLRSQVQTARHDVHLSRYNILLKKVGLARFLVRVTLSFPPALSFSSIMVIDTNRLEIRQPHSVYEDRLRSCSHDMKLCPTIPAAW